MNRPHMKRDPDTDTWLLIQDGDCIAEHKSVDYIQGRLDHMLLVETSNGKLAKLCFAWARSDFGAEQELKLISYLKGLI